MSSEDTFFNPDDIVSADDFMQTCCVSNNNDVDVYIVEDKKTYKRYVMKVFNVNDNQSIKYFCREVYVLREAKIEGFPFLKFHKYNPSENGKSFILTEYYDGGALSEVIDETFSVEKEQRKFDTQKMKIIYGIAFGLNYLHKNNIVHRDIKPANIFLDNDMNPYIGDFGFARVIPVGIKITGNIGSLMYMAPEIIDEDEAEYDASIDVYSFAITVLELLTYKLTLVIDNNKKYSIDELEDYDQFVEWIKEGKRYEMNSVPNDFQKLIEKCWDKNPKKRINMETILKELKEKKYFLNDADQNEFNEYVEKLDEAFKKHQQEIKEEKEDNSEKEDDSSFNEEEATEEFDFS